MRDTRVYQVDGAGKVTSAGGQNININSGEKSYDSTINKSYADRFIELQKDAAGARGQTDTLHPSHKQMETPGFRSGAGAEFELGVRRGLTALGIGDPNVVASSENFNRIRKQGDHGWPWRIARLRRVKRRPRLHQEHRAEPAKHAGRQSPDHRYDDEAEQSARRKSRCLRVVTLPQHGGRIDAGFDDALEKWAEANPTFPEAARKRRARRAFLPQGYPAQGALDDARKAIAAGKDRGRCNRCA